MIRAHFIIILIALFSTGCATTSSLQLHWDVQSKVSYRFSEKPFPRDMKVDATAMLANPKLLKSKIQELKTLPLDPRSFPFRLSLSPAADGRISVLANNVRVHYSTPPKNENERRQRAYQQRMVGLIQLNTTINQYGDIQDPFLKPLQSNLVSQLFKFPDYPVKVGESWSLPVVLTSLNTPFLADKTHRVNKVWVNAITDKPGVGRVVEIVYLIQENISGQNQSIITEKPRPFKTSASYFAVGEYNLNRHRWQRYVGRLDTTVSIIHSVRLIALVPDNKVMP